MAASRGSIIIPAYNEAAGIRRGLDRLFSGLGDGVEVIVACNGCTDGTADRARESAHPVTVLDLPDPGKVAAIRAAERETSVLPRVYLDADVEVDGTSIMAVLEAIADGAVAARPPFRYDVSECTWLVRRYYAARSRLESLEAELCGAGIYAFSAEARQRFAEFPLITGDDLFAARIVRPGEVVVVPAEPVVIHPARNTRSTLKVLKRVVRGNQEFAVSHPDLAINSTSTTSSGLKQQLRRPSTFLDAVVYAGFAVVSRVLVRFDRSAPSWERDDSSRAAS
ncbi:MAG TPA: glycosyltransferase [Ilumatobacteraceae bacterium]